MDFLRLGFAPMGMRAVLSSLAVSPGGRVVRLGDWFNGHSRKELQYA
jgi:hypothetical protein